MVCCYDYNFIVVAVVKLKEKLEKRIIFMKIFFVKYIKFVNLVGVVFFLVYVIFQIVKFVRFVGGKMMLFVFSSLQ